MPAVLNNPLQVRLNEILNPNGNTTFNMVDNHLLFKWVQPVIGGGIDGAIEFEDTGNFSGDLVHIHQHTGSPVAGSDLLHIIAENANSLPLKLTHSLPASLVMRAGGFTLDGAGDLVSSRDIKGRNIEAKTLKPQVKRDLGGQVQWKNSNVANLYASTTSVPGTAQTITQGQNFERFPEMGAFAQFTTSHFSMQLYGNVLQDGIQRASVNNIDSGISLSILDYPTPRSINFKKINPQIAISFEANFPLSFGSAYMYDPVQINEVETVYA